MMERVNTGTGATDMSEIYRIIPTRQTNDP
jgi:hypothetical protein